MEESRNREGRRIRRRGRRGMEVNKGKRNRQKEKEGMGHGDGAWHMSRFGGVCVKEQ